MLCKGISGSCMLRLWLATETLRTAMNSTELREDITRCFFSSLAFIILLSALISLWFIACTLTLLCVNRYTSKSILSPIYWELGIMVTGKTEMFSLCIPGWVGRRDNSNVYFQRYFAKILKLSALLFGIVKIKTVTSRKTRILDGFHWFT